MFYNRYIQKDNDEIFYIDYLGSKLKDMAEILCPDFESDFRKDYLDKIEKVIAEGKANVNDAVKEKYFWLEQKYLAKLFKK